MRGKREERRQRTKGNRASIGQGCTVRHHHGTWRRPPWPSRLRLRPCSLRTMPIRWRQQRCRHCWQSVSLGGGRGNKLIPSCVVNMIIFTGAPDAPDRKSHRCVWGGCDRGCTGWTGGGGGLVCRRCLSNESTACMALKKGFATAPNPQSMTSSKLV
jgi:hypothetical protein